MDLEARAQFDPIRRLPQEEDRVYEFLWGLPELDWSKSTNCPRWTTTHLAAHLVITAQYLAESIRVALSNPLTKTTPEAPLPFQVENQDGFIRWWSEEIKRLMIGGVNLILNDLIGTVKDLQKELQKIDLETASIPFWHPSGEALLGDIPTFRFFELQLHEWDIFAAENPSQLLNKRVIPIMIDRLPRLLARYLRLKSRKNDPRGYVRILLRDQPRNFLLKCDWRNSQAEVDDGRSVISTLTGQSNAFLLLTSGRAKQMVCEQARTFQVIGDTSFGKSIARILFQPIEYL